MGDGYGADDIMALVRREAELQSRSVAGQIAHWLKIGRAIEHSGAFDYGRIKLVLEGRLDTAELKEAEEAASKLETIEDARAHGYIVIVMHVGVDSPDLSVARVKGRTDEGGHDVPEEKVRARYTRGQPLIREAVLRSDRGMVFDNSRLDEPPRQVLVFANGRLLRAAPHLPEWVLSVYTDDLKIP